jgi:hypothetical protein
MGRGEFRRAYVAIIAAAGDYHCANSGTGSALHHLRTVIIKTVVRQVGADIN